MAHEIERGKQMGHTLTEAETRTIQKLHRVTDQLMKTGAERGDWLFTPETIDAEHLVYLAIKEIRGGARKYPARHVSDRKRDQWLSRHE